MKMSLKQLKPFLANFPKTRIAKTCHDGYHFYYKVNKEIRNSINLMEGIDVRGDGGYVLAPPSVVDDKSYIWVNDLPIAEARRPAIRSIGAMQEAIGYIDMVDSHRVYGTLSRMDIVSNVSSLGKRFNEEIIKARQIYNPQNGVFFC